MDSQLRKTSLFTRFKWVKYKIEMDKVYDRRIMSNKNCEYNSQWKTTRNSKKHFIVEKSQTSQHEMISFMPNRIAFHVKKNLVI